MKRKLGRLILCIISAVSIIITALVYIWQYFHKFDLLTEIPESANKFIFFEQEERQYLDFETLRNLITRYNEEEDIYNSREFGPVINDNIIFVILVNEFSEHLKYLIASLSSVKGIQDVLVIFSHSFYDPNINKLIQKIDFCRVLQIFYPFSLQLNPIEQTTAHKICLGFCTDRDPKKAEEKHHWWWTANKVFDGLSCTSSHTNFVIFLEHDQYLLEDFLYMAMYMKDIATVPPQCNMITLSTTGHKFSLNDSFRVEITTWDPLYHSEVVAFDYNTWITIVSHFDLFCIIDDYSWPRSLQYLSLNLDGNRFKVISSLTPRSFRTTCGLRSVTNCGLFEGIYKALSTQKRIRRELFPRHLEVYTEAELLDGLIKFDVWGNVGWKDSRDKELCNNITIQKYKKLLLDMETQFLN